MSEPENLLLPREGQKLDLEQTPALSIGIALSMHVWRKMPSSLTWTHTRKSGFNEEAAIEREIISCTLHEFVQNPLARLLL